MTEQIDLDDMDAAEEQDTEEETPNRGDWFWKGEGDPDDEPGAASWRGGESESESGGDPADATTPVGTAADAAGTEDAGASGAGEDPASADESDTDTDADADADTDADIGADGADAGSEPHRPTASPHVPSDTAGTPAGIPVSQGGGGAGSGSRSSEAAGGDSADADADAGGANGTKSRASGPHGGGADDMTTAFTYRAAKRLAAPAAAFADAEQWSDWIGIVGDVEAHVLGAFQRNETIDADFFNGSGTGPAERLAGIDAHSMFYADRMVVVGVEGEEAIAEEAGWEFVPLEDAAAGAGWTLVDPDGDESESAADADADPER